MNIQAQEYDKKDNLGEYPGRRHRTGVLACYPITTTTWYLIIIKYFSSL